MTHARDDHSLSRLELVVLARLSSPKPPSERELGDAVLDLALPGESPARAREAAVEVLAALRGRALVSEQRRTLTEDGGRALRAALGLGRTPTWLEVRDLHLPALALGVAPGSKQVTETLRKTDSIAAAVLRARFAIDEAPTVPAVCDALVAEALGLPPGPLTLARIRTHVLAGRAGVEPKGTPVELAVRVAAATVRARRADKRSLTRALGRRWVYEVSKPAAPPPPMPPSPPSPPLPTPRSSPPVQPAPPVTAEALLAVVRETIPRVGAEGRFGAEKVFVSAIWRGLERDRRLADLSLDRFKRWLVTANRDGWLVLARADLVGAMDARLVSESEIEDQGDTFHFVLDQRNGAPRPERESHVR